MNPTAMPFKRFPSYINGGSLCSGVSRLTRRFKSDGDDGDDERPKKDRSAAAADKLNELLRTMKKGNDPEAMQTSKRDPIKLAQPRQLARKASQNLSTEDKPKQLGEKLADAAASVAQSMGGDQQKTESELLNLLRIYNSESEDEPSVKKSQSSSARLDDLISGMKIDRSQPKSDGNLLKHNATDSTTTKAQRIKQLLGQNYTKSSYWKPMDNYVPINLFSSEPLDIFKNVDAAKKNDLQMSTWDRLYEKHLDIAVMHPPKNIYEQMVIWTEQGKLWKFPIDNEQGMNDEKNVFFAEHVFLEPLIDEWCPSKGPIRHFMELVCVGLSKNPFLTVQEKQDHINWFRQYFYEKNQLLNEVGAYQIKSLPENVKEYYKPSIPDE